MLISVDGFFLLYICITFFILRTSSKQKLTKGLKENWQIKLGPGGGGMMMNQFYRPTDQVCVEAELSYNSGNVQK